MKSIMELTDIANSRIEARCVIGLTGESTQEDKDIYIQKVINEDARNYLSETDWYVVRLLETEVQIPSQISTNRAEARSRIVE